MIFFGTSHENFLRVKELFVSTNNKFIASSLSVFVGWVARDILQGHAVVDIILTLRGGFATI